MKIVALVASPHKKMSNTKQLTEEVLAGAAELGAETEIIDLCSKNIRYCTGCANCLSNGSCVIKDDVVEIQKVMAAADGIIWASPTYFMTVTAQMKTFIDRQLPWGHCPQLHGKVSLGLSVSAGLMEIPTARYMDGILEHMGCYSCGIVTGIAVNPGIWRERKTTFAAARRKGAEMVHAIEEKLVAPPNGDNDYFQKFMRDLIYANRDFMVSDHKYWSEKGWFNFEPQPIVDEEVGEDRNAGIDLMTIPIEQLLLGMPRNFNPAAAEGVEAVIQFELTDVEPKHYHLIIANGECAASTGLHPDPRVTIYTSEKIWREISAGKRDGAMAYVTKMYKVKGDLGFFTSQFSDLFGSGDNNE